MVGEYAHPLFSKCIGGREGPCLVSLCTLSVSSRPPFLFKVMYQEEKEVAEGTCGQFPAAIKE